MFLLFQNTLWAVAFEKLSALERATVQRGLDKLGLEGNIESICGEVADFKSDVPG